MNQAAFESIVEALCRASKPHNETIIRNHLEPYSELTVFKIMTIMYYGRDGEDGDHDLKGFLAYLIVTFGSKEKAIRQISQKMPLSDYLKDGLARAKQQGIDIETAL